jgi:3-hydroxyisobutyrate dehydrogenase-like beta-hydroxyacid dehydrogenase
VLQRLAGAILHIGPLGTASALKLAMNVHIAGVAQALCESLSICRAAGIPDQTYFDALHLNAARSGVSDLKEPKLLGHDFSPQFSVKHMAKDLKLAKETAEQLQRSLPQADRVLELYEEALGRGWAEEDYIGLIRLLMP